MAFELDEEMFRQRWLNDGRWGPKAVQTAHPGFVEYVERLVDHGLLDYAFRVIADPSLFYALTPGFPRHPVPAEPRFECPEPPSPPTNAEIRHLLAYALRAAGQIEIALSSDGFWVRGNDSDGLIRFRGLPLTEPIVELILPCISPPKSLRGETHPNSDLEVAVAQAVERNPKISNRASPRSWAHPRAPFGAIADPNSDCVIYVTDRWRTCCAIS